MEYNEDARPTGGVLICIQSDMLLFNCQGGAVVKSHENGVSYSIVAGAFFSDKIKIQIASVAAATIVVGHKQNIALQ